MTPPSTTTLTHVRLHGDPAVVLPDGRSFALERRAALAEGVAWIHRTMQGELATEFHASFRDKLPAHRELLAGR